MKKENLRIWLLITIFCLCGTTSLGSCSSDEDAPQTTVERIKQRGTVVVGTTGDYRPLSFCEPNTGEYWGFGIEMAKEIARQMNELFAQAASLRDEAKHRHYQAESIERDFRCMETNLED